MSNSPKYASGAANKFGTVATGNTALDGTGTVLSLFPAVPGRAKGINARHLGTNAVNTVLRIFLNKNSGNNASAADNILIAEQTILASTLSQSAQSIGYIIPLGVDFSGLTLKNTDAILCAVGTTIAAGLAILLEFEDIT